MHAHHVFYVHPFCIKLAPGSGGWRLVRLESMSLPGLAMSFLDWQTRLANGHPDAVDHFVRLGVAAERNRSDAEFTARLEVLEQLGAMQARSAQIENAMFSDSDDQGPNLARLGLAGSAVRLGLAEEAAAARSFFQQICPT